MRLLWNLTAVLFCLLTTASLVSAEEQLGVHGFVRVGVALSTSKQTDVKLTQVQVELYSPSGVRLLETDCAPNGYFFIPLSKPGRYTVKPKGFQGWSFTPAQKIVECGSKECNGGQDLIFEVNGFSINGKIQVKKADGCNDNQQQALNAIVMKLRTEGGEELSQVSCRADGSFSFDSVMPGEYRISAEHSKWNLIGPSDGIGVKLGWQSIVLEETFMVEGFRISGSVKWKDTPMKDIQLTLLHHPGDKEGEDQNSPTFATRSTDAAGMFTFEIVPCGRYMLVPSVSGLESGLSFGFTPVKQEILVSVSDVALTKSIEVSSFSIHGSVVHQETNKGIEGVQVFHSGKPKVLTDGAGRYVLHDIQGTTITLNFSKEGMHFKSLGPLELSPLKNEVPAVFPYGYSVCGSVIEKDLRKQGVFTVQLSRASGAIETTETDKTGAFCLTLEPGSYTLEVKSSIVFAPKTRKIHVTDSPMSNIRFVQKKVNLAVSVKKLAEMDWGDLFIKLATGDGEDMRRLTLASMKREGDVYSGVFSEVSPGEYRLEVVRDGWCWKKKDADIVLSEEDAEAPTFEQIGLEKRLMLTHDAKLEFRGPGTDFIKDGFYQGGKVHHLCFSSAKMHTLNAEENGCFVFNKDIVIDPTDAATSAISASGFKAQGKIHLPSNQETGDVVVQVKSKTTGHTQSVSARPSQVKGEMVFEFDGILGELLEISPEHETLLFNPAMMEYSHSGTKCAAELQPFWAREGTFITGTIYPLVADARVQLIVKEVATESAMSSESGTFSFGPYYDVDKDSEIVVEKQGYEFTTKKVDETTFAVQSIKLVKVEVAVSIKREDRGGVLIALAGMQHGHRGNAQTNSEGIASFWKLPADSYYIKPMLKEYEFTPAFLQVELSGMQDERVAFEAVRTGFSVFGIVSSLNNQPLADVSIQARAADFEESCVSDQQGAFHLQNLKPGVPYTVSVLTIAPVRMAWPESIETTIERNAETGEYSDISGVQFVAYRDDGTAIVNGVINTDAAQMSSTEVQVLKTVRSDGVVRLVSTLKPYFNGWIEVHLPYPGKYTFKVINKQLESSCQLPSTTISLDAHSPREVHIGELYVNCTAATSQEIADYKNTSYWPVLITLIAILAVPFRNAMQGTRMPSD